MTTPYLSVNPERRCLKCGKPSVCFYTKDEKLSFCARAQETPDFEIENYRWKIFTHVPGWKNAPPKKLKRYLQNPPLLQRKAPLKIRNTAYRMILEASPPVLFPSSSNFFTRAELAIRRIMQPCPSAERRAEKLPGKFGSD
jgi:hypothetical protein